MILITAISAQAQARAVWTPRQREVMRQVGMGRTHRQIAAAMGLNEETIRYHHNGALLRLRAKPRAKPNVWIQTFGTEE